MTANIVTFAAHHREAPVGVGRRVSRKDLDRDLVRLMRQGLGFTVADASGDSGGR